MTIYSVVPAETIFEGWHTTEPASTQDIVVSGVGMAVEMMNFRQARVVRLYSTDPNDYLKSEWQPGSVIELSGSGN